MASGRSGQLFKTWGLTNTCEPELYFEPTCEDDLRQVDLSQKPLLQLIIRCETGGEGKVGTRSHGCYKNPMEME